MRTFHDGNDASPVKEAQSQSRPRILVIHHSAIAHEDVQAPIIERTHHGRGYAASASGSHIAYHFLVGKDGTVRQNRGLDERTEHTSCGLGYEKCVGEPAVNEQSIAIVVAGNFEEEEPTPKQLRSLKKLIKILDAEFHFDRIIGHREASPTSCPGRKLLLAIKDLLRDTKPENVYNISRYYTPVQGQKEYYRTVSDKDFIHKMLDADLVRLKDDHYWFSFSGDWIGVGETLEEADAWFRERPEQREALRKELEYMADFRVNCSGDCLITANGYKLQPKDAFKVAACPPEMPFGTKLKVGDIGIVTCVDRGGAIKEKRLDIWAGIGMDGLNNIRTTKGGPMTVTEI